MSEQRRRCVIPASHPALPGHFPGRPIVPGVVLLDCVVESILAEFDQLDTPMRLHSLPAVKFLRILQADEAFDIVWFRDGTEVSFRCLAGSDSIAEGRLQLTALPQ